MPVLCIGIEICYCIFEKRLTSFILSSQIFTSNYKHFLGIYDLAESTLSLESLHFYILVLKKSPSLFFVLERCASIYFRADSEFSSLLRYFYIK